MTSLTVAPVQLVALKSVVFFVTNGAGSAVDGVTYPG